MTQKPLYKPQRPFFAAGPCAKFPGWSLNDLKDAAISRSHRSQVGQEKINEALFLTREVLEIPTEYHVAMVPGSATGAIEMVLWNLVGQRPLQVLVQDVFSDRWAQDISKQLKLAQATFHTSPHGQLPELDSIRSDEDILLNWNGSTAGVKFPNADWISAHREALVISDTTSAVFTTKLPWDKFDATVFSWQKGLGSEAAHGTVVLSPRALTRLETYSPPWPIPFLFKLKSKGKFNKSLFEGKVLNTPSLLCIEDYIVALKWAQKIGGLPSLIKRSRYNFELVNHWVSQMPWVSFLAEKPETRSTSTICLKVVDAAYVQKSEEEQRSFLKGMSTLLMAEGVAVDILNHVGAPPSLRFWGGPTVEAEDIQALLEWMTWSFESMSGSLK